MRVDPLTLRIWRIGIGLAVGFDAVQLVIRTRMRGGLSGAVLPVPAVFRALAVSTPGLMAVALVAVIAASFFARGKRPVLAGLVALAANRVLLEAFGALDGIYDESSYHAAAAITGWVAGLAFAAVAGGRSPDAARERESLAGLGAAAMFGATYLNAGLSKLQNSGLSWADSDTIRLLVLSHRAFGASSWLDGARSLAGQNATVAMVLSMGTLVIQCGAFVFPWTRRTRLVWGALFVAFHTGIHLVAGSIFFFQAAFLAALFACPWPSLLVWARRTKKARGAPYEEGAPPREEAESKLTGEERRRLWITALAVVAGVATLVLLPIRPRAHPIEKLTASAPVVLMGEPEKALIVGALGPLRTGKEIADGWILRQIAIESRRVSLTVTRAAAAGGQSPEEEMVYVLDGTPDAAKGPFDTGSLHISYHETPLDWTAYYKAGRALARTLTEAAAGQDMAVALKGWVSAARR